MPDDPRDWVALLSPCGNARKYFKDAADNAPWVDKVCDGIVEALLSKDTDFPASTRELAMLDHLTSDPLTRKVNIHRNKDGRWELAVDFKDVGSWSISVGNTISEAITKLYDQETRVRGSYKMKPLEQLP